MTQIQTCYLVNTIFLVLFSFVKFCTWRDAVKAIETYDGFYVGSDVKLRVRVAHRRRSDGDIFSRDDDDGFSEGVVQDLPTNDDTLLNGSNNKLV